MAALLCSFGIHMFYLWKNPHAESSEPSPGADRSLSSCPESSRNPIFSDASSLGEEGCHCPPPSQVNASDVSTPAASEEKSSDCSLIKRNWLAKQVEKFQQLCFAENKSFACRELAILYFSGVEDALGKDVEQGLSLLESHCQGLCSAQLGDLYKEGSSTMPKSEEKALQWYRKGCQENDTTSCNKLAEIYGNPKKPNANAELAAKYDTQACLLEYGYYYGDSCRNAAQKYLDVLVKQGILSPKSQEGDPR